MCGKIKERFKYMRELITYNFDVKLEYLDEYKSNHKSDYYCISFQVLAEDCYKARNTLEKWLEHPEQTGWKYKTWVGITPMITNSIIIDDNFALTDEDDFPIT